MFGALTHGQSVVTVFVVYFKMAAFSHACSSIGGFALNALATNFPWHFRIAPHNLPIFLAALASHFPAFLSKVKYPPSSPPGHTMAPAVEEQMVRPSAT